MDIQKRQLLKMTVLGLGAAASPRLLQAMESTPTVDTDVLSLPHHSDTCHWLGPHFWGNRLQDWRQHQGRLECLARGPDLEVRTVSWLTRTLTDANQPARLSMTLGQLEKGPGFAGFLLGVGQGALDYRGAALAQRFAGKGGGLLAVINHQGQLSFRDFSDPEQPLEYERLSNGRQSQPTLPARIKLDFYAEPRANQHFDLRLEARTESGQLLDFALLPDYPATRLVGGVSLVSSAPARKTGGRWWFEQMAAGGAKLPAKPERELGPVMGCLYSLNQTVLKLSVQLMPVDLTRMNQVRLAFRANATGSWTQGPVARIEDGFVALFRISDWQSEKNWQYRVKSMDGEALFTGTIAADPGDQRKLNIALLSCIIPTSKSLDDEYYQPFIPQETLAGRYTPGNILFPHATLTRSLASHQPDLFLFVGDQYYETFPTRYGRATPAAKLDTLYRWYLWYWSFRDLLRHKPCIVLADDHDVLQGNLWGNAGESSEAPTEEQGGFKWDKSLVRMVYRIQHGHNPDSYDPTPIAHDIPPCYGNFVYGNVNFAFVEDRKFKSPPDYVVPQQGRGELLGQRQEDFLRHWANTHPDLPRICITASMWGTPQTGAEGEALVDYDANGYPPDGRTRAVQLLKDANALALAGDQHLGLVAIQGVETFDDGPVFFTGPAAAAFWQRWFEGNNRLPNQRGGNPDTGDFIDSCGNKMRVLAVANPKISFDEFVAQKKGWGMFLADRSLTSEGYGLVTVDHQSNEFVLHCYPTASGKGAQQYPGWPCAFPIKRQST
ncbi:alkaline phosphatase D family protein [Simiduia agarivorans]|uniref:PhoD-like phosphatase metallophosphatase domain-containing protein n=1 Tax=Simiduia agarivorans (strain DSM 21679 / JCM 13881 / BCRC 17597 / SA1) TaxID=1117647 RepID=K4KMV9_SIMAS|nr:alkaline phosphatase D family protein [Simiduia agarivorans]AFV00510.1 hypothetical protein M5M_16895 [Simiduia agarivorans SA1 = DSM 21679]